MRTRKSFRLSFLSIDIDLEATCCFFYEVGKTIFIKYHDATVSKRAATTTTEQWSVNTTVACWNKQRKNTTLFFHTSEKICQFSTNAFQSIHSRSTAHTSATSPSTNRPSWIRYSSISLILSNLLILISAFARNTCKCSCSLVLGVGSCLELRSLEVFPWGKDWFDLRHLFDESSMFSSSMSDYFRI